MPRYIDSGSDDPDQYLGNWLDANLVEGIQSFRCQSGYFAYSALAPFSQMLHDLSAAGKPVHLVLGSNSGSLTTSDLEPTLDIVQGASSGSLTVVAYRAGLFHPKTIHLVRSDGSAAAVVGSSNFTEQGLGLNAEASVVLDTSDGDDALLVQQVADAIDRWRTLKEASVFSITSQIDIQTLTADGVINLPQPPHPVAPPAPPAGGAGPTNTLGNRRRRWRPAKPAPQPKAETPAQTPPLPHTPQVAMPPLRWCKKLESSDAQWVSGNTKRTGKLRLTKAHFPIDKNEFFRRELFGLAEWRIEPRDGIVYDVAKVEFSVTVRGSSLGTLTLSVDHAPHRVAGQANVPTVLAWGSQMGQILSSTSYVGSWVVIERDAGGNYSLVLQDDRPIWAP